MTASCDITAVFGLLRDTSISQMLTNKKIILH